MDTLEYFIDSYVNDDDDYLMHYGIKGMKWKKGRKFTTKVDKLFEKKHNLAKKRAHALEKVFKGKKKVVRKFERLVPIIDQLGAIGTLAKGKKDRIKRKKYRNTRNAYDTIMSKKR